MTSHKKQRRPESKEVTSLMCWKKKYQLRNLFKKKKTFKNESIKKTDLQRQICKYVFPGVYYQKSYLGCRIIDAKEKTSLQEGIENSRKNGH